MTKEAFREARDRLAMTQMELAAKMAVHWRTIQKWEGGERAIPGIAIKCMELLLADAKRRSEE